MNKAIRETFFYDKDYFKKVYGHIMNDLELYKIYSDINQKNLFKGIRIKKKKILEYGCGLGKNIYGIKGAVGFDVSHFALHFCNKLGIETTRFPKKNYYDIIVCSHMLEHTENPSIVLKKLRSYLKEEGLLILMLPYERNRIIMEYKISQDNHMFNWNFQNITNLLLRADYTVLKIDWPEQGLYYKILKPIYSSRFNLVFNITKTLRKIFFMKKEEFRVVVRK